MFLLLALSLPAPAEAATTLGGTRPLAVQRETLPSTTDWEGYTVPGWVRQLLVCNAHASGTLLVGDRAETGTVVTATDEYKTVPPGACLRIPISPGQQQAPATHLTIPLASSTASLPVEFVLTETSE